MTDDEFAAFVMSDPLESRSAENFAKMLTAVKRLTAERDAAVARVSVLEEALEWIRDAHIPDQPAACGYDELNWIARWVGTLRRRAASAINGDKG